MHHIYENLDTGGLIGLYEPNAALCSMLTLCTCDAVTHGRICYTMLTFLNMYLKMLDCDQDTCVLSYGFLDRS